MAWRVALDWRTSARRLDIPLHTARIAALSGDARPRQGSARCTRPARLPATDASAFNRHGERYQERSFPHRILEVSRPRYRRDDLLHRVLRYRHRLYRLAAEHHECQGL